MAGRAIYAVHRSGLDWGEAFVAELRVVRGEPTAEELAALVTVLSAAARRRPEADEAGPVSRWRRSALPAPRGRLARLGVPRHITAPAPAGLRRDATAARASRRAAVATGAGNVAGCV
jgi:hypothetical protein